MSIKLGSATISDLYVGSNKIAEAYVGSDLVYSAGGGLIPITDLAVGDSVFLKETGILKEYIIIQKGRPTSAYDSSCDGVWLLRKDLYKLFELPATTIYGADNYIRNYASQIVDNECASFYSAELFLYDSVIVNATIPSRASQGSAPNWSQQNTSITRKCFAPSATELGFNWTYVYPTNSAKLSYFDAGSGIGNAKRQASYNGTLYNWMTRSTRVIYDDPNPGDQYLDGLTVSTAGWFGSITQGAGAQNTGLRPCLIVTNAANVKQDTHELSPSI